MKPKSNHQFSNRIKSILDKAGVPERGRAAYLSNIMPFDISSTATRKWLSGNSTPSHDRLPEVAKALGVDVNHLFIDDHCSEPDQADKNEPVSESSVFSAKFNDVTVLTLATGTIEIHFKDAKTPLRLSKEEASIFTQLLTTASSIPSS